MLCKTFSDLEQANEYAKGFLLAEWDRDAFESYDVSTNQDGLVTVNAIFLEGETGTVEVRKLGTNTKPVEGSWNVWILLEKNGDDSGWKIKGVFQSKSGAMIALENRAVELGEVEKVAGVKYRIVEGGRDGPDPMYARRIAADGDYETVLRMEKWPVKS